MSVLPFKRARAKALDHEIRFVKEFPRTLLARLGLEIKVDALLPACEDIETLKERVPGILRTRSFDAYDVGTEIRQQHGRIGRWTDAAEQHALQAPQRAAAMVRGGVRHGPTSRAR